MKITSGEVENDEKSVLERTLWVQVHTTLIVLLLEKMKLSFILVNQSNDKLDDLFN